MPKISRYREKRQQKLRTSWENRRDRRKKTSVLGSYTWKDKMDEKDAIWKRKEMLKTQDEKDSDAAAWLASDVAEYIPHGAIYISKEEYLLNKDIDLDHCYYMNEYYYTETKFITFIYKTVKPRPTYFSPIINEYNH
jgi:hypothetical protein